MSGVRLLKYHVQCGENSNPLWQRELDPPGSESDASRAVAWIATIFNRRIFEASSVRFEDDMLEVSCREAFPYMLLQVLILNSGYEVMRMEIPVMKYLYEEGDEGYFKEMDLNFLKGWQVANTGIFAYERQQRFDARYRLQEQHPLRTEFRARVLRNWHAPKYFSIMEDIRRKR